MERPSLKENPFVGNTREIEEPEKTEDGESSITRQALGFVPGVGTAISTAADVANIARDVKKSTTGEGEETSKIDSKITTNATRVNQKNEKIYDYGAPEDEVVVIDGSQDQNAGGSQTMGSPDYGAIEEEIVNFDSEDSSNMYLMGTQSEFNIF